MKKLISFIPDKYRKPVIVFLGISFTSIIFLLMQYKPIEEELPTMSLSESIPDGFVVVPVELENHESISDIIDSHGVVDLYKRSSSRSTKVARAVRLIRLQPLRFAALIPEERTSSFLSSSLQFYAVVQNINKQGVTIYDKRKRRVIVVEEENLSNEM